MKRELLIALLPLACLAEEVPLKVRLRTGKTVQLPLERYVGAVLTGEGSTLQSPEALKAMAVAIRTYAVRLRRRHSTDGFDFCDTTHCQRLEPATARMDAIASATSGELLWFEGKPAFTPYSADCGGRIQDAASVWPEFGASYLTSRTDPHCTRMGSSVWQWDTDPGRIAEALRQSGLRTPPEPSRISIAGRTASGRARTLLLGDAVRISASSFRLAIGRELGWNTLRSDLYEVRVSNGRIFFEGSGWGHGVGLCQRGAEQMGLRGRSYREILAFYIPGTASGVNGRGLRWQRLSGERITLLTTRPERDSRILASAERSVVALSQRTSWPVPQRIEIRAYPDIDSFRNTTGEPGWVAARTEGARIHVQPLRDNLDSVLVHELVHVLIESQAGPGLPVWFREGLAGYLERSARAGAQIPPDADLRQTTDPARARRAYAEATAAVAGLVKRYGEPAVLGWVRSGLPPEVTKASSNPAARNSK